MREISYNPLTSPVKKLSLYLGISRPESKLFIAVLTVKALEMSERLRSVERHCSYYRSLDSFEESHDLS